MVECFSDILGLFAVTVVVLFFKYTVRNNGGKTTTETVTKWKFIIENL